ncbi:hypothetical protein IV38_GL001651 [Lactobacillus selangorensis]|uniref:Phosphoglycerate mutase n=1 Tax=Lactobacillus selangorensis TaxID=81857 RepID=A0A0R2FK56_9LACO|nr:histidine phosphatase family protein [Lactobacillus selangorensis]KRN28198.1 hypothetical protein IV38_GL001651 [Lactobacillus selangorensis]KRN30926.1 hypothetical protein IV40_GL001564 [Lactobacillus selangorensis]
MKPIDVYLVRHGQTVLNRYNRMQGWCDSPLTEKGLADADHAGKMLSHVAFDSVYSSDTTRAARTAEMIIKRNLNQHPKRVASPLFREEFYGYFEGNDSFQSWYMVGEPHGCRNFSEIIQKYSLDKAKDFMKETDPWHDAENAQEYWTRLGKGFKMLREQNQPGSNVLIVSHGTTIRSIVNKFDHDKQFDVSVSPKNGSVTHLQLIEGGIEIVDFNRK